MNLDAYLTCVWLGGHARALAGDRTGAGGMEAALAIHTTMHPNESRHVLTLQAPTLHLCNIRHAFRKSISVLTATKDATPIYTKILKGGSFCMYLKAICSPPTP